MGRKRLNHAADTLCDMFCGWRLANSYRGLEQLGSGRLEIDVLRAACRFNGQEIDTLPIAGELSSWFVEDCAAYGIPLNDLSKAASVADLELSEVGQAHRQTREVHFDVGGQAMTKGRFNRLVIRCVSEIALGEHRYGSKRRDVEEWPVGWPG